MKPVTDLWAEQDMQYQLGNSEKVKELQKKITKEQNRLIIMSKRLLANETYVLIDNAHHIVSSSETNYPLIIKTNNDLLRSLITVLHARYDNNNQYAAITNYSLGNLITSERHKDAQQGEIKKSCQHILQKQNEGNKIVRANFFVITSNLSESSQQEYCSEHTNELRNIIKTELENICKITTLHYEHKEFKDEEVIATLYPKKANLNIGYLTVVDI